MTIVQLKGYAGLKMAQFDHGPAVGFTIYQNDCHPLGGGRGPFKLKPANTTKVHGHILSVT